MLWSNSIFYLFLHLKFKSRLICYNFEIDKLIFIIFGRQITEKAIH